MEHKPLGLEGIDEQLIEDMTLLGKHVHELSLLPDGYGWLVIEVGGDTKQEADDRGREIIAALEKAKGGLRGTKLYDDPEGEKHIWDVREAGLGATAFIPGQADTYEGWEDSAVPPERLGEYLRKLKQLADRYEYRSALYGHYGQGCIHARWNVDPAPRRRLPAGEGEDALRLPGGRRQLCACDRALCRHRQVPRHQGRRDVSQLPGDARGEALDARPGAPAVGDVPGRRSRGLAL